MKDFNQEAMNFVLLLCLSMGFGSELITRGPSFLMEPPNRSEFSNSSGTLIPCSADGRPTPRVNWVNQDGEIISDIPGLRHVRHDGSLAFPPFPGEDYRADVHAAVYRCIANNEVGTIGSRDVHVRAVVLQRYEIRLFDEFVLRGNMAVIRCPVPSFVSDYVRVTSWERIDGFLVTPGIINGKYGMLENGDLYIRDTTEHDSSYSFRCHTENTVTREKKVSTNFSKIIVTEPHHSQPPRVTRRTPRVVTKVGERATLSCIAQGYPIPSYRWHKIVGDQPTLPDLGTSVRQEGGVLVFHKVSPLDAGRYGCLVSNSMGEDKVDTELVVEETLRVVITPSEVREDVGRTTTFNCTVSGSPLGTAVWKKDMRFLSTNSRIMYLTPTVLRIRQAKRVDAGMYQCFVQTDTQSAQAAARLHIGDLAPKFKAVFSEKILRPGSYLSLMCIATGNPAPQIQWTLDRIWPLSTRPGILVSTYISGNGDVISFVNITSVDVSDSGVYTCEATNDAGKIHHSRRLNVEGPLLIRPLTNLTALAGDSFTVLCPFGGYPFDDVRWKRDGRLLPVNQRQRVYQNGTLVITEVQPGVDDGRYSCEVTSGQGMPASRSFRIVIRTGPKVSNFAFKDNLHEGMRTAVTCIVVAGDGPLTTRWLKDGRPLSEGDLDATVLYAEGGFVSTLTIKTLAYRHNGNYTCVATNDVATGSYSALLTVKVPPRWILEPSDTSAIAGRSSKIDCQADGVPQPHVRWKMATGHPPDQFKTIVSSSHVHILVNGSLNFRNVESSDAGFYLCEANNGVGPGLSTVVRFTVHSAPQFQSKFSVLSSRRGERTVIECSSRGDRPMTFTWKKNGLLLDPALEPRYAHSKEEIIEGDRALLVIEKVERRESALFTCIARNDFGEDSTNIQLTVQDTPDAPQNLEVHDVSSRAIRLTWNRPFDGNSPITQYEVVWRQLDGQQVGGPQSVAGTETTMTVRGLKPLTRYFFRVKGQNSLGDSEYSAEVAVTTLEEPPRKPPKFVKAVSSSSRSINVTWQMPSEDEGFPTSIEGFYVGFKLQGSSEPFTFKPVSLSEGTRQHFEISNLNRYAEYNVVVQAFNSRGAGPPSEEVSARTSEFDKPGIPIIKQFYTTSTTIKLSWELNSSPNSPISGYVLHHCMDGIHWMETHLAGDRSIYTLHDLQCGTTYHCYLVAINSAGRGNSSEIITAKTDGNPPIAPEKRLLLTVNSTSVTIHLNSWHNGGCPILTFVIQYKASGQQEWTLVSNNIIPEQVDIAITDLIPGTWYSLLMTARSESGSTDAEYIFATLTVTGEQPPRPSEVTDVSSSFYRHLTITVPVVSSAMVLIVVLCVVCLITRRRTTGCRPRTPDGADGSEPIKPEHMPLSVTYESTQEPAYFPAPYATSRVPAYNREHNLQTGPGNTQNMGTFGSTRSGYTYDIPYPPRRTEKGEGDYEPQTMYFPSYHTGVEMRAHRDHAIYEVPDRGRVKLDTRSWREAGDGNSSTESDNEELLYSLHSQDDRMIRDEARESETECDRLWKTYEGTQYEGNKRWTGDHAVLS